MRILALRQAGLWRRGLSTKTSAPPVVDCEWVHKQKNVKILDAAFSMAPKADHNQFLAKDYGDFKRLMKEKVNPDFVAAHIPGAIHFNLDISNFPGRFARFGIYPPKVFENYMQLLGVNNEDSIVVYGRGPAAGMLFASRVWWTLKLYGHEAVSVLDGGFAAWQAAGYAVTSDEEHPPRGNWTARGFQKNRMADFDELTSEEHGQPLLDQLNSVNFLDTRVRDQFEGKMPQEFPAKNATGYHIAASKNVPIADILTEKGLKSKEEVAKGVPSKNPKNSNLVLESVGFKDGKPTYMMCNRAIQAALVSLALERNGIQGKVYNGSMEELSQRASHFINAK